MQNEKKIEEFERKMKLLKEEGLFPQQLREVGGGTRFLFISYGGTGADALFQIRRTLKNSIPKDQYQKYFRFLAVDTDKNTMNETETVIENGQKKTRIVDTLETQEFLHLDNVPARSALQHSADLFEKWMDPRLPDIINATPSMLRGDGASATRQIGRLTLFPDQNSSNGLVMRINNLVGDLTHGNADDLRVMIITGIAGGTGSGIVIDATYLIRYAISRLPGGVGGRTKYYGFVMLPPTGTKGNQPTAVKSGNRNGYAALKEINQFMTLASRGDKYVQRYNGMTVESDKNIFETCYLLDGNQSTVSHGNPRAFVKNVLADCMLDMVTSMPVDANLNPDQQQPQAIDSLLCDVDKHSETMVRGMPHKAAPRDVDYIYCVLGHGNTDIPVDLVKTYVAKLVFDWMYKLFLNCSNVTEKDGEDFVKKVRLSGASELVQRQRIDVEIENLFLYQPGNGKCGPCYVINMLNKAADYAQQKARSIFETQRGKDQLSAMAAYFLEQNNEYFTVYTKVMEVLGSILTRDYNLICKGQYKVMSDGERQYTFGPISLDPGHEATDIIRRYLNDLVTPSHAGPVMVELLQTIQSNRKAWSQLFDAQGGPGEFDAVNQLRKFWSKAINKIVDANIEDLLIKVYSGNNEAKYDPENPASMAAFDRAATAIFNKMLGTAGIALPTAELDMNVGLSERNFSANNLMFVPKQAPHLLEKLRSMAKNNNMQVEVYSSSADNRISCYTQFSAIPAFKFKWVQRAEEDYEEQIGTVGLHMSETIGGSQWRDFPNLLPRSTWWAVPNNYVNPRENTLADRAVTLFENAKRLFLTKAEPTADNVLRYSVLSLPEDRIPNARLFKEFDIRNVENASALTITDRNKFWAQIEESAMQKAKVLFDSVPFWQGVEDVVLKLEEYNNGLFAEHTLDTTAAVLTPGNTKPADWDEYVAACFLRKMPDLMVTMRGTVQVMLALAELIRRDRAIKDFCRFVVAGQFQFNAPIYTWEYTNGLDQKVLLQANVGDQIQAAAPYYFMYQEFAKDSDSIVATLQPAYDRIAGAHLPPAEKVQAQIALNASAQELYFKNQQKIRYDPRNPDVMSMFGSTQFATTARLKGYDAEVIKKFYIRMNETLVEAFGIDPYAEPAGN